MTCPAAKREMLIVPPESLFRRGKYTSAWIKDFYTQSDIWWGPDAGADYYPARLAAIARLCGPGSKRILELGAGSGAVAALLAQQGHQVVAVELTTAIRLAQGLPQESWTGSLVALEADFYSVHLNGCFDVVCYWDGFGLGSDTDQRGLLRRVARDWLLPGGCMLVDVFNPARYARCAGTEEILPPLKGVPGSVEMRHLCHYDPVQARWIDEWQPTSAPDQALAQTVRCYSPADLRLLLEGTGLELVRVEVDGAAIDFAGQQITTEGPLLEAYSYLAQLAPVAQ